MSQTSGSPRESLSLFDAALLVATGSEEGAGVVELEAVAMLGAAPPEGHWDHALLSGLRHPLPKVREATIQTVLHRLTETENPEHEDRLLAAILDACVNNLSGRPRRQHLPGARRDGEETHQTEADVLEGTSARLIQTLTQLLKNRPLELEHHRSRLLARSRQIEHLPGRGLLARAIVAFQKSLGDSGERSDQEVASQLFAHRKLSVYGSPYTTAPTLEAYLLDDRRLGLEGCSQDLFRAYRWLLSGQSKERARGAMLLALGNLRQWLELMPQSGEARRELLAQTMGPVRSGEAWEAVDLRLRRQLEAHLELVPGRAHPEDLLRLLEERFDSTASEELLIAGLGVLSRLPFVRMRSEEICRFILRPGRRRRSEASWQAFFDLVEALLTGLEDFVLSEEALSPRQARHLELLRRTLSHDQRFRELLYAIATDGRQRWSDDETVEVAVRRRSWKVLLRSLPPNLPDLLREGLLQHQGRLFFVTLEEAGRAHRRELWNTVLESWQDLIERVENEERRHRIVAVLDFFVATRAYRMVQDEEAGAGLAIRLALDDADDQVREAAENALQAAGYSLELERERLRRQLLAMRQRLTESNEQIIELEARIAQLHGDSIDQQIRRGEVVLNQQELLQERDFQTTRGFLDDAEIQVDLEEVHGLLEAALAAAAQEMKLLQALRQEMAQHHQRCRALYATVERLVDDQKRYEAQLARDRRELTSERSALSSATSNLASLQRQRNGLREPIPPSRSSDPEEQRRRDDEFQRQMDRYNREHYRLGEEIRSTDGDIQQHDRTIKSLNHRIAEAERQLRRLQAEIDQRRGEISSLESALRDLGRRFSQRQEACRAIREEIRRLRQEVSRLEDRFASQKQSLRGEMALNRRQIEDAEDSRRAIQSRLQELSALLNQTGDRLDRQQTESQRLIQSILGGREHYDRVAESAIPQSRQADVTGTSMRHSHEHLLRTEQESLVQHVEALDHALRRIEPSPPRRAAPVNRPKQTQGGKPETSR